MEETNLYQSKYSEFLNRNLQEIEDMKQSLILSINRLEKKQPDIEQLFDEIMPKIRTLSAIYSNFNSIKGIEYVLRLKVLLEEYKKKYITEGIDFELISFIIDKISVSAEESIETLTASEKPDDGIERIVIDPRKEIKHKWFTFEKNGFWFILKYNEIKIIKQNSRITEKNLGGGNLEIAYGKDKFICRNLFPVLNSEEEKNNYYIISNSGNKNYSASKTGKKIYASKDFITSKITGFRSIANSGISPGRVKIFGKNHIVLN